MVKRTIQYIGLPILYLSLFILVSCGEIGGSGQCGGAATTGACIRIESIAPDNTSNVDARRNTCATDPDTGDKTYESFTDHNAKITISNSPLPGASSITNPVITLQNYSISYSKNNCQDNTICPDLDPITAEPGQTITIAPESSATFTIPFVPLRKKSEFANKAGSLSQYPSYTANYTITGSDTFNNTISVRGHAEFTIGDYDNCSQ